MNSVILQDPPTDLGAMADPVALVRQLDVETIRNRLDEIDREREALRVLLRAAQRARQPVEKKAAEE